MPVLNIEGVGRISVDDSFTKLSPDQQASEVEGIISQIKGGKGPAPQQAPQAPQEKTSNPLVGMAATAEDMAGNFMEGIGRAGDYLQSKIPLPTFGDPAKGKLFQDTGNALEKSAAERGYDPGNVADQPSLLGKAAVAANKAIAGAPHIAAALNPGTLAADFVGNTNANAEERARNDGRSEPGLEDAAVGGLGAAVQEALGRVGARAIAAPVAKSALGRIATAASTDAATGAGGGAAQYLATHAGTDRGATLGGAEDAALEGAAVGVAGGGLARGTVEGLKAPVEAVAGRKTREASRLFDASPEQASSELRIGRLYDDLKASQQGTGAPRANDSVLFKKGMDRLKARAEDLVTSLHRAGEISKDELDGLRYDPDAAIKQAAQHNRELDLIDLDRVDRLERLDPERKSLLKETLRDLNTATANSLYKVRIGPAEEFANGVASTAGRTALAGLGYTAGGLPGVLAAAVPAAVVRRAGRAVDDFTGARQPPAIRRLDALREVAEKRGIDPGDTMARLESAVADAREQASNTTLLPANYLQGRARAVAAAERIRQERDAKAQARQRKNDDRAYYKGLLREVDDTLANHPDAKAPDPEAVAFQKSQEKVTGRLRGLDLGPLNGPSEDVRARVRAGVSPDAPVIGGPFGAAIDMVGRANIRATPDDVVSAINRLAERGAITPEELPHALNGSRFPDLIAVARETAHVAQGRGASVTPEQAREQAVQQAVQKAQVRAETQRRLQAMEQQRLEEQHRNDLLALARFTPPEQLQEAVQGLQERKQRAAATRAQRTQERAQAAPQAAPGASPLPGPQDYGSAAARSPEIVNKASYAATLAHRDTVLRTALQAAGDRADLKSLIHNVEAVKTKAAKQNRLRKAEEQLAGDPEGQQFVRDHLAVLSLIGGKDKAPDKVTVTKPKAAAPKPEPQAPEPQAPAMAEAMAEEPQAAPKARPSDAEVEAKAAEREEWYATHGKPEGMRRPKSERFGLGFRHGAYGRPLNKGGKGQEYLSGFEEGQKFAGLPSSQHLR